MVRYKRYKRRYSGTRSIKMRFQSFMDVNTSATSMQIITISAGGKNVMTRLPAQFAAYKYYKLGSVSVKLVPASTLPVDPTGLSYEAGEPGVDPRDQLTPGLMRITNGEDVFEDISGLSDAEQHGIYNNMLLDPRWFKWMLQSGVKRFATPRFWQIGQLHQDKWPGAVVNMPMVDASGNMIDTCFEARSRTQGGSSPLYAAVGSSEYGLFQTGHSGRLGWMPTDALQTVVTADGVRGKKSLLASPPEVEVMKIILPKAYKTEYYYRLFITETVYFREPILQMPGYRPLDVFHRQVLGAPSKPNVYQSDALDPQYTGGNYGDD